MVILGSTGSIGVNALSIARDFSLKITALCANSNIDLLNKQIEEFNPKYVAIGNSSLRDKVNHKRVFVADQGILDMLEASFEEGMILVNALVGFAGLNPSLKATKIGYKLALANKESLVVGGAFFDTSKIIPIDSEHFGLWYLQSGHKISNMIITASGGAFRDTSLHLLKDMTPADALNHPNWKMGKKITIDSATMTNKIFELLEAKWLFGTKKIDALIETKSIIHALINFKDGSTTAHIANADMRLPIAYALLDKVDSEILKPVNLLDIKNIEFREIKTDRYPIWQIKELLLDKSELGVVINAANEEAIKLFFNNEIGFCDIAKLSLNAIKEFEKISPNNIGDIFLIDKEVRDFIKLEH